MAFFIATSKTKNKIMRLTALIKHSRFARTPSSQIRESLIWLAGNPVHCKQGNHSRAIHQQRNRQMPREQYRKQEREVERGEGNGHAQQEAEGRAGTYP